MTPALTFSRLQNVAVVALLVALGWAYSNHFLNPFQFDDSHTIVTNGAIRDLHNFPRFFTDASTFSTLPSNQSWRPGVTTQNAIDTWLSGGIPRPLAFHISIFVSYLLLGVVLFLVYRRVLEKAGFEHSLATWGALFGTGFFCLHTANAETINYIIARSDSFSTLLILASFLIYQYSSIGRRYYLFLLPIAAGFLWKETAATTGFLFAVYLWLFGDDEPRRVSYAAAAIVVSVGVFLLTRMMTPATWTPGGGSARLLYAATQVFVLLHYVGNFVLPIRLSADSDMQLVARVFDPRVIAGTLFLIALLAIAWRCRRGRTRPITFGICWFLIALGPTSSIVPFAEVENDHRTFFPYIGLVLVVATVGLLVTERLGARARRVAAAAACALLFAHALGTHHRNTVWGSEESLWRDVTEKSPHNGRGWMNYGLTLMDRGDFTRAMGCFSEALSLLPAYSYAHINMAIAQSHLGDDKGAEINYLTAIAEDAGNPEAFYYYGMFLKDHHRRAEAIQIFQRGLALSPHHAGLTAALASAM